MGNLINPYIFPAPVPVWESAINTPPVNLAHVYNVTPSYSDNPATMTVTTTTGGVAGIKTSNSGSFKLSNQSFANGNNLAATMRLKDFTTGQYYGIDYPYGSFVHSTFNGSQVNHGQLSSSTSDVFEVEISGGTISLKLNGTAFRTTATTSSNFSPYFYKWGNGSGTLPATYTIELTGGFA